MKAKLCHCCYCWVAKSCPTLCDPMDCDPNVSYYTTINNIASKELFESSGQSDWIQGSGKNKVNVHLPSSTLWPHGPCKASLFMGFPRQEYWSGLLFPSPGDLPDPGIEPASPAMAGGFLSQWAAREAIKTDQNTGEWVLIQSFPWCHAAYSLLKSQHF